MFVSFHLRFVYLCTCVFVCRGYVYLYVFVCISACLYICMHMCTDRPEVDMSYFLNSSLPLCFLGPGLQLIVELTSQLEWRALGSSCLCSPQMLGSGGLRFSLGCWASRLRSWSLHSTLPIGPASSPGWYLPVTTRD